ncbi:MAG: potassium/proton antiporter [Methanobrevibacter sp.]|jgi:cell volume regulation protein A|nr:potassium/proton antiporter [Candidatus Methanovirga basalitermitum]
MIGLVLYLFGFGFLLLVSILLSKLSSFIGIPVLLVFLILGMLLGSDGIIHIYFDNYLLVQYVSIVALIFILFSGGLDTNIKKIRPVAISGISLATIGVLITAIATAIFIHLVLGIDLIVSLIIGSIISSTDVAAVISIFKTSNIKLKNNLDYLLEFESAVNDPMANTLTISFLYLLLHPTTSIFGVVLTLLKSLAFGSIMGYLSGKVSIKFINKIDLESKGLYPVLLIAIALLSFACSDLIGGNGFLSVYVSSLLIGNSELVSKKAQLNFFDGLAWLMQIIMFTVLGLLVFPSQLLGNLIISLIIAFGLIVIARPIAIFVSLFKSKFNLREKIFVSWTGIKGAVPIVFATYPLVEGIPQALTIFNIVFFITLISVILQGSTIKLLSKKLNLVDE